MKTSEKIWFSGLALIGSSVLLFGCWGLSAAIVSHGWNPFGEYAVIDGFNYCGVIFRWPTAACALLGVGLTIKGFRRP